AGQGVGVAFENVVPLQAVVKLGPFGSGIAFRIGLMPATALARRLRSGTDCVDAACGWVRRRPSYETKKKGLCPPWYTFGIHTGPPNVPPKSFWRRGGCGWPR